VLGKTEGNGGVNDFTREYAVAALCNALSPRLKLAPREVEAKIAFVMSGGTEGVLSPHITLLARSLGPEGGGEDPSEKRVTVCIAHARDFLPDEIGHRAREYLGRRPARLPGTAAYFSAWAGMTPVAKATAAAWVRFMQCNLCRAASRCVFTLPNAKPKISAISW
jgi:hypothetical protein